MSYESERKAAIESVLHACTLCDAVRATFHSREVLEKEDRSPVTIADFGAQAVISHHLALSFPHDPLMAEEASGMLRQEENAGLKDLVTDHVRRILPKLSEAEVLAAIDRGAGEGGSKGRFWALDPIDGTKGFLRGGQYATALALVEDGEVVVGVLGCPNLPLHGTDAQGQRGCLFVAVRGQGAIMKGFEEAMEQKIEVARATRPSDLQFCESVESSHSAHGESAQIAQRLGITKPPVRMDSQCKYGMVARGDAAIYLRLPTRQSYMETVWDHAAGSIIVEEAGGKVTDMEGKPLDFSLGRRLTGNRGIVVTNGGLHDQVLHAVERVFQ
ncbi:MAG: 3'(2'),5'-bisphosphate nucleotidase [Thermodesulfobacteriota bacterium]|nr:3'(2'),5'-bisphosphate nucleotidase [Thermodesulfobacteriota bacterium]